MEQSKTNVEFAKKHSLDILQDLVSSDDNEDNEDDNYIDDSDYCDNSDDKDSVESEHYYHHIANPNKVISVKDLQINRLKKQIYFQTLEINQLKLEKQKLETQDQFIKSVFNFMKIQFSMEDIKLEPTNERSIINFKDKMLNKALEFSEIKKLYNEIVNWKDIDSAIKTHFIPLVETKYSQMFSTYSVVRNNKSKSETLMIIMGMLVLFYVLVIGF